MTERRDDEVLVTLDALVEALDDFRRQIETVVVRADRIHRARAAGLTYAEIMANRSGPLVSEVVSSLLGSLLDAGSRFRQAEARALYEEGLSLTKIAALFGVSRQRVSALLRDARRHEGPR